MLGAVRGLVEQLFRRQCHACGQVIDGPYVLERVKVPGYTGRHEKAFCSEAHLEAWQDYVARWEDANYEVPMSNTGPTCAGC